MGFNSGFKGLNSVRGRAVHSALLPSGSNSYICTPLTTIAGEATDLIAANHTFRTQAAASDDRYLSYVSVLPKPCKRAVTQGAVFSSIIEICFLQQNVRICVLCASLTNNIGWKCSMYRGEQKCVHGFGGET